VNHSPATDRAAGGTDVVERTELITSGPAQALAGLLGVPLPDLDHGAPLPLLWHWVYLLDRPPQAVLGEDGHPAAGGIPSPPGPGRRRMFAGGRVTRRGPLRTGSAATRRTWEVSSTEKHGRSGRLVFVTVRSEISQGGRVVVTEEQDIVYRDAAGPPAGPPGGPPDGQSAGPAPPAEPAGPSVPPPVLVPGRAAGVAEWPVEVSTVLLFRFSALTYNGHRIHYDRDFARDIEGYPGLVVHGPLQALLMAELARRTAPRPLSCEFTYRLVSPLFEGQGLIVSAAERDGASHTAVRDCAGRQTATGALCAAP
jgi:3-methylfumaryl-CoA hydratase